MGLWKHCPNCDEAFALQSTLNEHLTECALRGNEGKIYDPQLDTYSPRWLPLPKEERHYPIGACMLFSHDQRYIGWGAVAGFWNPIKRRWICVEDTFAEHQREYRPTHYAPTPRT